MSIKLKELYALLLSQPHENIVRFDFGSAVPTTFDSARGDYSELALGFDFEDDKTISDLIVLCAKATERPYEGYKGGQFTMTDDTPVWVDNYGKWSNTAITGVTDLGYGYSIINTKYEES